MSILRTAFGAVTLGLLSAWSPAMAGDSTSIIELDEMVVRATRQGALACDIIDSTTISRLQDSKNADGLLVSLPGIDVQRTSPSAGKGTGVSIRGLDESRSLILLNGRPLNGAGVMGGDYVDWSLVPTTDIARIEVSRGVKSAEYGNTIGGVINIVTQRDMTKPTSTSIRSSYGIVSPEHADDAIENRATDVSLVHHANILNTAALDLFAGYASGEPYLRNNYFNRTCYGGEFSVMLPLEFRASAGFRSTLQQRGFAIANTAGTEEWDPEYPESIESAGGGPAIIWKGGDYYFGDRSYWKNTRTQMDFSVQKLFSSILVTALAHINDQDRTEYFYALGDTNALVLERFAKPEDQTWGWNIFARQNVGTGYVLKYGAEGTGLRYSNSDIRQIDTSYFRIQPSDGDPTQTIRAAGRYGVFFQSFLDFGKLLSITPGIRYDYYIGFERDSTFDETTFHGVSPNGAIALSPWVGAKIEAGGAYVHRFPTCPELYWYYEGYRPSDRKELSPERAAQAELGLSQDLSVADALTGSLSVRGYYYNVKDYLRTIFGYRPSRLIYNIDNVTLAGFECDAVLDMWKGLRVRANYTYQTTEKTGDTYDSSMVLTAGLPELPRHKLHCGIEYGALRLLTLGCAVRFVGRREVITGNPATANAVTLEKIDPFATVRLYGSCPVWTRDRYSAKLDFGIDNLLDAQYEEEHGIPMPGITGTGAIDITF
ncbi:MAG: TonB-dependent receptor [Chitinispirillaceae bacterium]|nr:TonB-dependent receptor [Chitinispirillaceae bacterium]